MKKRRYKVKNIFWVLLLISGFLGLSYGAYQTWQIYSNYSEAEALYDEISEVYTEIKTDEKFPIEVDFTELCKINEDIIGWIYIEDTVVSYPLLQGDNNFYYLDKSYYKKYLASGSIYLDCANNADLTDSYNIIYGHNMKNHTMFGDLDLYSDAEYLKEHAFIDIILKNGDWLCYKVFSAGRVKVDGGTYEISENLISNSEASQILILSTCTEDSSNVERFVVKASLYKKVSCKKGN